MARTLTADDILPLVAYVPERGRPETIGIVAGRGKVHMLRRMISRSTWGRPPSL
jgi:hypothetical protein